jgi:predicted alpha/beta-hydrolase family hydrolase
MTVLDVETPHGLARAHLHPADEPRAALVLMHGAAVGVDSPDLTAVTEAARPEGVTVALMEQPYWVAGRKSPAPANQLDGAFVAVVERLKADELHGLPLIAGGRSLGARVACRTAEALGAVAVLCLAFPFQAPRRKDGPEPGTRLDELDAVALPTLVVQGERDQFGRPPEGPGRMVTVVPGNHSLKADTEAVAAAVRAWLPGVVAETTPAR